MLVCAGRIAETMPENFLLIHKVFVFLLRCIVSGAAGKGVRSAGQVAGGSGDAEGGDHTCAILQMVVRHTTPVVRPDDVLTALRTHAAFEPPRPPLVTRLTQGPLEPHAAQVADPLADDPTTPAP